jgi:hypothetical protein
MEQSEAETPPVAAEEAVQAAGSNDSAMLHQAPVLHSDLDTVDGQSHAAPCAADAPQPRPEEGTADTALPLVQDGLGAAYSFEHRSAWSQQTVTVVTVQHSQHVATQAGLTVSSSAASMECAQEQAQHARPASALQACDGTGEAAENAARLEASDAAAAAAAGASMSDALAHETSEAGSSSQPHTGGPSAQPLQLPDFDFVQSSQQEFSPHVPEHWQSQQQQQQQRQHAWEETSFSSSAAAAAYASEEWDATSVHEPGDTAASMGPVCLHSTRPLPVVLTLGRCPGVSAQEPGACVASAGDS